MLCSVASCKLFYSKEQGFEILSLLFVPPTERRRNGDYYGILVSKIKTQSYGSIDDVYSEIDVKYAAYSAEIKAKLKALLKEVWDYWEGQYKKIASQERPWTEEELAENPDLASYTREEVEEMERKAKELGIVFD